MVAMPTSKDGWLVYAWHERKPRADRPAASPGRINDNAAVKCRIVDGAWSENDLWLYGGTMPARLERVAREALAAKERGEDWRELIDRRTGF
jgi:hypothetical protein